MAVTVKITVEGNNKVPISYTQGKRKFSETVTGRGSEFPREVNIPFVDGKDAMSIVIGPQEPDNG